MNTISSYRKQSSKRWTNLTLALCLWLVTPPSSKAATETLNGEGLIPYWILKVWHMIVPSPIGDIFRLKESTQRVGCWNVQILYQTGNLAGKVVREMKRYKIELFEINETRWTWNRSEQLVREHQIPYYERIDKSHSWEVA